MTDHDFKLLRKAHDTKTANNQDIEDMIPLAESDECRGLLRIHWQYLANREKMLSETY